MNRHRFWFIALGVVLLLSLLGILGLLLRERTQRQTARQEAESPSVPLEDHHPDPAAAPVVADVPVRLFFRAPAAPPGNPALLLTEPRRLTTTPDRRVFALRLVEALIAGPTAGGARTLPAATTVRQLYIHDTTVVVDFSREITLHHPGGVLEELATIYSVVNTLLENLTDVQRVRLLVDGKVPDTLAGHVSLDRPFLLASRYQTGWRPRDGLIQEERLE